MLHALDDYPIHQTAEPLAHVATESPNAYDRYFFNGFNADGSLFFAVALGVYPNRGVMDGAFSVIRSPARAGSTGQAADHRIQDSAQDSAQDGAQDSAQFGVQFNVRASRRCPTDRTETVVGPLRVTVTDPMKTHRIELDGRHGIAADLTCTAISPVVEEPRFTHRQGGKIFMDYTRLTQFGSWQGWIDLDGERIELGTATGAVHGVRDRSWGVRPVGDPIERSPTRPQFFWLWAPTVFDDVCTHIALNHDAEGRPWHQSGAVMAHLSPGDSALDAARVQRSLAATADIGWQPGTRWAETLTTKLDLWRADEVEITYDPMLRFAMSGLGYRHPEWGHGRWVGEDVSTRDEIDLSSIDPTDPLYLHVQTLSRASLLGADGGSQAGVGIVEQLVVGAHEPSGLTGIVDGYRPAGSS